MFLGIFGILAILHRVISRGKFSKNDPYLFRDGLKIQIDFEFFPARGGLGPILCNISSPEATPEPLWVEEGKKVVKKFFLADS